VGNNTPCKYEECVGPGASMEEPPAAVAKKCKYIIAMSAGPPAAFLVLFDRDGILEQICSGKRHIAMSTVGGKCVTTD
jgi:glyoxylate/succinic semialdehyde reductase